MIMKTLINEPKLNICKPREVAFIINFFEVIVGVPEKELVDVKVIVKTSERKIKIINAEQGFKRKKKRRERT